ncbi:unnamed protein product [Closterium sp. NIES-53]
MSRHTPAPPVSSAAFGALPAAGGALPPLCRGFASAAAAGGGSGAPRAPATESEELGANRVVEASLTLVRERARLKVRLENEASSQNFSAVKARAQHGMLMNLQPFLSTSWPCSPGTMFLCPSLSLFPCPPVLVSPSLPVPMSPCPHVPFSPCSHVPLSSCPLLSLFPCPPAEKVRAAGGAEVTACLLGAALPSTPIPLLRLCPALLSYITGREGASGRGSRGNGMSAGRSSGAQLQLRVERLFLRRREGARSRGSRGDSMPARSAAGSQLQLPAGPGLCPSYSSFTISPLCPVPVLSAYASQAEKVRAAGGAEATACLLGVPLGHNSSFLQGPAFAPLIPLPTSPSFAPCPCSRLPQAEKVRAAGGAEATACLLGVPLGHNSSFLQGPAFAPPRIREAIWCGSTNSATEEGKDLNDIRVLTDVGDVPVQVRVGYWCRWHLVQVASGAGEGGILVQVASGAGEGGILVQVASGAGEGGILVQVASGAGASTSRLPSHHPFHLPSHCPFGLSKQELGQGVKGVYVSIDIDCLDPAFAPGVSHIEPGGLSFRDVMNILQNLKGNVVAGDVVELNPQRDTVDGMTAMVAAKFVRELAARISK